MQQPDPSTIAMLARIPLLADLASEQLQDLGSRARRRTFQTDEAICHRGDPGDTFYAIASGIVRIVLSAVSGWGQETVLVMLGPGEFFGELSLFDGQPRSATAIAMGPTETVVLERSDFLAFLQEQPQASLAVLAVLSRRLRRTDELIGDTIFLDVRARLCKKLLELADTFGEEVEQGVEIAIPLRRRDLANMVGASREGMKRYLTELEGEGSVQIDKQRITLLRPEELRRNAY